MESKKIISFFSLASNLNTIAIILVSAEIKQIYTAVIFYNIITVKYYIRTRRSTLVMLFVKKSYRYVNERQILCTKTYALAFFYQIVAL